MAWEKLPPIAAFFAFVLAAHAIFNALVRREYGDHVDAWLADGRPRGLAQPLPARPKRR